MVEWNPAPNKLLPNSLQYLLLLLLLLQPLGARHPQRH
jgi:hypothetical protein